MHFLFKSTAIIAASWFITPLAMAKPTSSKATSRPNILVVMVDDLGFSDLGCYGSEIQTPTLDRLAANGLRFSQFYNTAKCHSSRVSLLSGQYCIQAGDVHLSKAVTSAEVLGKAGYFTMMTGKWHLKKEPTDFGFDRYFGHLSGACNFYKGDNTFRLNGEKWNVPKEGFYTTIADVDHAIHFLGEARKSEKPWYLYIAFNAPHAPLQPLKEDYEKYQGHYTKGWDVIRNARLKKQRDLGLFGKKLTESPRPDHIQAWDTLSADWKIFEEKRMMALAGMIDRVDQELGRLVANLEAAGELDNTMILFISDNGACPYDRKRSQRKIEEMPYNPNVTWADSTGWAWMRNSPFQFYKQNQFEGGISTPAIVHWPAGLQTKIGSIIHDPAHIIDVLPTLSEIGKAPIPDSWPGRHLNPVSGVSLAPIFAGKSLNKRPPIHLLYESDRGLRIGDWKLVSFKSQPWELYNMANDRTELNNLASKEPERLKTMIKEWHRMAVDQLQAPAHLRKPVAAEAKPHTHREWSDHSKGPTEAGPKKTKSRRIKRKTKFKKTMPLQGSE
ncbi:MAG: arylsulfatase [Verrucomicrobiae bacterium]|nr:arylsulfatase [Verrucomicrobiae bacterium]NNJ43927.1 arylsulfatase [Akkermansiaceae bacterium]